MSPQKAHRRPVIMGSHWANSDYVSRNPTTPLSMRNLIWDPPYRPRRLPSPDRQNNSKQNNNRGRHNKMPVSIVKTLCVYHPPCAAVNCEVGDVQRHEFSWSWFLWFLFMWTFCHTGVQCLKIWIFTCSRATVYTYFHPVLIQKIMFVNNLWAFQR